MKSIYANKHTQTAYKKNNRMQYFSHCLFKSPTIKNIVLLFLIIAYVISQISACGTPVKKSATRKKIHTNEANTQIVEKGKKVEKIEKVAVELEKNEKLIFSSNRTGNLEIWISDLNNSNLIQLTDNNNYESWWPRMSPDKSKVLFYRTPVEKKEYTFDQASLWLIDIDGKNEKEIIPNGAHNWTAQSSANWSPDGTKIIMSASTSKESWQLYITDTTGNNPTRVSKRESVYLSPSWSPDGGKIVYSALPDNYSGNKLNNLEIFISDSDGNNEQRITNDTFRDDNPMWSPDGLWIAFETEVLPLYWVAGKWSLRIASINGSSVYELLNDGHANRLPRWNSQTSQLYFNKLRFPEDKQFGLWRINQDGSNLYQISGNKKYKDIQVDIIN